MKNMYLPASVGWQVPACLLAKCTTFNHSFLRSMLLWMAFLTSPPPTPNSPSSPPGKPTTRATSNSTSITIPTTGGGYNYEVDWNNDGIYDQTGITGNVTHDFGVAGTYTIRIRGTFPRIYFNGGGDRQKLLDVGQWGDLAWTVMNDAFYGCSNLKSAPPTCPI